MVWACNEASRNGSNKIGYENEIWRKRKTKIKDNWIQLSDMRASGMCIGVEDQVVV